MLSMYVLLVPPGIKLVYQSLNNFSNPKDDSSEA